MSSIKRQLNIDLDELSTAMEMGNRDTIDWWLDVQTGQIILVSDELDDDHELRERSDADEGVRYVHVPDADSRTGYKLMAEFIGTVSGRVRQDRLRRVINGKGEFRRFKDVLLEAPAERERWFRFSAERQQRAAAEWLAELGIQSSWQPSQPPQRPEWQSRADRSRRRWHCWWGRSHGRRCRARTCLCRCGRGSSPPSAC